jgi:DNA/RNA-binding domain of Phe-tRNA-synthetase-like protein
MDLFMQILQQIGPEAMLQLIQLIVSMDQNQLQQLVQQLQEMMQQGAQQGPSPEEAQVQANANMFG